MFPTSLPAIAVILSHLARPLKGEDFRTLVDLMWLLPQISWWDQACQCLGRAYQFLLSTHAVAVITFMYWLSCITRNPRRSAILQPLFQHLNHAISRVQLHECAGISPWSGCDCSLLNQDQEDEGYIKGNSEPHKYQGISHRTSIQPTSFFWSKFSLQWKLQIYHLPWSPSAH